MHQASVGFHCPECVKGNSQQVYQGLGSLRVRPILTQALIAVNVAVFLVGAALSGGNATGGSRTDLHVYFGLVAKLWERGDSLFVGPAMGSTEIGVGAGEFYRMATSGFLHYGLFHLGLNMFALWILGNAVENHGGRLRFGMIYALAILGGSLGALLLSPGALTAGASGGIYGLMGAFFIIGRAQGIAFRDSPLFGILLINLVLTFAIPGISIGGHLGGLAAGALAAWVLFDLGRRPGLDRRIPLALCVVAAVAFVAVGVAFAASWSAF